MRTIRPKKSLISNTDNDTPMPDAGDSKEASSTLTRTGTVILNYEENAEDVLDVFSIKYGQLQLQLNKMRNRAREKEPDANPRMDVHISVEMLASNDSLQLYNTSSLPEQYIDPDKDYYEPNPYRNKRNKAFQEFARNEREQAAANNSSNNSSSPRRQNKRKKRKDSSESSSSSSQNSDITGETTTPAENSNSEGSNKRARIESAAASPDTINRADTPVLSDNGQYKGLESVSRSPSELSLNPINTNIEQREINISSPQNNNSESENGSPPDLMTDDNTASRAASGTMTPRNNHVSLSSISIYANRLRPRVDNSASSNQRTGNKHGR